MIHPYPDGELELGYSETSFPPGEPVPDLQPPGPSVWLRVDGGPWRLIPGERSAYAAGTAIARATTVAEALALLLPCPEA